MPEEIFTLLQGITEKFREAERNTDAMFTEWLKIKSRAEQQGLHVDIALEPFMAASLERWQANGS